MHKAYELVFFFYRSELNSIHLVSHSTRQYLRHTFAHYKLAGIALDDFLM